MPRFSLKRLFLSTTLICLGIASFITAFRMERQGGWPWWAWETPWYAAGALAGAGIAVPFVQLRYQWIPAAIGVLALHWLLESLRSLG